jgi:hypothetical protein
LVGLIRQQSKVAQVRHEMLDIAGIGTEIEGSKARGRSHVDPGLAFFGAEMSSTVPRRRELATASMRSAGATAGRRTRAAVSARRMSLTSCQFRSLIRRKMSLRMSSAGISTNMDWIWGKASCWRAA